MISNLRKSCSQCGAPIDWAAPEDFTEKVRALAKEAEAFMGEPVGSVWVCSRAACGEIGFFGAVHVDF